MFNRLERWYNTYYYFNDVIMIIFHLKTFTEDKLMIAFLAIVRL
jgi:hypothetical protein